MRVLVVIVNFRAAELVADCLVSLRSERDGPHDVRVTVVDNPGGDDSLAQLRTFVSEHGFCDWVEVVATPRNGGFAYGVNAGVRPALAAAHPPDAFLLLNPDTWVRPGAVTALADFLEQHPEVGMAGSRLEDPDGTPQHSRFRFPSIRSALDDGLCVGLVTRALRRHVTCPPIVDTPHEIDWLSGAATMVRRSVFERTGEFDDGYFLYFEELDFARRAHALGFRSWYVPQSRIVHLVGRTTGVTVRHRRPPRTPAYWFESRNRYFAKHHNRLYKLAVDVAYVAGRSVWHLLRVVRRRPYEGPPHFLRDFVRYSFTPGAAGSR